MISKKLHLLLMACILSFVSVAQDIEIISSSFGTPIAYSLYPLSQLTPIAPCATISVVGAGNFTTAQVLSEISLESAGTLATIGSAVVANITTDTELCAEDMFTPTTLGKYTVDYTAQADGLTQDNSSKDFEVNNYIYARDRTENPVAFGNGDDGNGNTISFEAGNIFEIINSSTVSELMIYIHPQTSPGSLIYGVIYQDDSAGFLYQDQTPDHVITAADLGQWVSLKLSSPIQVDAGTKYLAAAGHYGGPNALYLGLEAETTTEQNTVHRLDGTDNTWYSETNVLLIRMNIGGPATSIPAELEEDSTIQIFPNPTNGLVNIQNDTPINDLTIEVFNAVGQSVLRQTISGSSNTIDLLDAPVGLYVVKVTAKDFSRTSRLLIQ